MTVALTALLTGIILSILSSIGLWYAAKKCRVARPPSPWSSEGVATALSLETGLPMLVVRRQAKEYGTAKGIEGEFESGERVVLVEDVLTTAGQAIAAAKRLTDARLDVIRIIYVIDREGYRLRLLDRETGAVLQTLTAAVEMRALYARAGRLYIATPDALYLYPGSGQTVAVTGGIGSAGPEALP